MKSLRVVLALHEIGRTGAPMVALDVVRQLASVPGTEVMVVSAASGALSGQFAKHATVVELPDALRYPGSPLVQRVSWAVHTAIRSLRMKSLLRSIRRWGPDLVYFNSVAAGSALADLMRLRVPVVTHVHEMAYAMSKTHVVSGARALLARSDRVIACSESVRASLHEFGVPRGKIEVVHSFLPGDPPGPVASTSQASGVLREAGVPPGAFVVGAVGRIAWHKGSDLFVQVARAFGDRVEGRPVHFVWLGGGTIDEVRRIRHDVDRAGASDRVHLLGERTDAATVCGEFDVSLLVSREDSFPLVMLEAAVKGVPVIGFEGSGGFAEFAALGGGVAVPYIDLDRMVREVRALLRDEGLRARVGERGRATVERHFARDGACSRIVSIVETLASSVPAVGVAVGGSTPAPAERAADSLN